MRGTGGICEKKSKEKWWVMGSKNVEGEEEDKEMIKGKDRQVRK